MIGLIGGTKYDEAALEDFLRGCSVTICTGTGRGAETFTQKIAESLSLPVVVIGKHPELYGDRAALAQAEWVLASSLDSDDPIVLVGKGQRVDFGEQWLKRANWGKEVIRLP